MIWILEEIELLARKYALLNASSHDGKADRGAVLGRIMAERSDLRKDSKLVGEVVGRVIAEISSITPEEQEELLKAEFPDFFDSENARKKLQSKKDSEKVLELPELPGAVVGSFVTRFPPEPNGFMHIGHAKAALLGSEYRKKYKGKFIVRFDDTNPSAEKLEYYDAFLESFKWLGIEIDAIRNSSDDMDRFYGFAEKLIIDSKAYVCTCTQEKMRALRGESKCCEHRDRSSEENLEIWHKMVNRAMSKSEATLRYKGDMASLNTAIRDPVIFRIILEPHPLLGNRYAVWPTYDFAGPVEDSLDGVTHALRSKEYELRDEPYHAILHDLGLRHPIIIEFSRLGLQNTTVSKRKLRKLIDEKLVEGWDDPRLPTIEGLKKRGILADAIREFVLSMGLSKVESEPTWDLLESINRKLLDPIAKRFFFVPDPVKLVVENAPKVDVKLAFHPDKSEYGERTIATGDTFYVPGSDANELKEGSIFRLIEAYNVKLVKKGNELRAKYESDEKAIQGPKLQWVAEGKALPFSAIVLGPLLVDDTFNPKSLEIKQGLVEDSAAQLKVGDHVQFVRFGFCRIDADKMAIRTHK